MASRDQRKMGLKAKSILQKRIVNVTSVIKLNFDLFSGRLQEEGLIPVGRYNPEDRVMNKSENATALYGDCMTAVEVNPTKFSVVMDILSEFSLLEAIVQEMTKEGVKAGLMKPRKDRKPSKKEASVKMQADRKRKHRSDDQEVNKKEKKTKRTNWKTTVEISSDSPSSGLLPPSSNSRTVSMGPSATALPILGTITSVTPLRMTRSQLATIKRNICEAIACQPAVIYRLADELDCVGLIIPAVQQTVKFTDGKSPYEKADAMIGPAIEHVQSDPKRNASALMTALTKVGLQYVTTESHLIAAARPVLVSQTELLTQPHVPLSENIHTSPPVEPASVEVVKSVSSHQAAMLPATQPLLATVSQPLPAHASSYTTPVQVPSSEERTLAQSVQTVSATAECIQNIDFLEKVAQGIPAKWRMMGIALGVSSDQLDGISQRCLGDQMQCFLEVFDIWKNYSTVVPFSWVGVVQALQRNFVGEHALATELMKNYSIQESSLKTSLLKDPPTLPDFLEQVATFIPTKHSKFGMVIGVKSEVLRGITAQHSNNQLHCFESIFSYWEKGQPGTKPFKWSSIVTALANNIVGEKPLAKKIDQMIVQSS